MFEALGRGVVQVLGDSEHAGWEEVSPESVAAWGAFDGPVELLDPEHFKFLLRIMRAMYGGFFVPLHPVENSHGEICIDATCRAVTDWELRLILGRDPVGDERIAGETARDAVQENVTVAGMLRAYPVEFSGQDLLSYAADVVKAALGASVVDEDGNISANGLQLRFWRQVEVDGFVSGDVEYWGMCDDCVMMELPDISGRFIDPLLGMAAAGLRGPRPEFIPPVPGVVTEDDRSWLVFDDLSWRMLAALGLGDELETEFVSSLGVMGARDDMPFRVLGARIAVPGIFGYAPGTFPVRVGDALHGVPFAGYANDGVSRRVLSVARESLTWHEGLVNEEMIGLTRVEGTILLRCGCPLVIGALGRSSVTYVDDEEWLEDDEGTGLVFGAVFGEAFSRVSDSEELGITPVGNGLGDVEVSGLVEGSYLLVNGLTRAVFRVLDMVVPLECGDMMHGLANKSLETSQGEGLHVRAYLPDDGRDILEGERVSVQGILCFEVFDGNDNEVESLQGLFEQNDEDD